MLSPERVIEIIIDDDGRAGQELSIYWWQVASDRESKKRKLNEVGASQGIVPLVIRSKGFDSPNSLLSDVMELLQTERDAVKRCLSSGGGLHPFSLVLISRSPLGMPQISSPAQLPEWFPQIGGHVVTCHIRDIELDLGVSLDAPESGHEPIAEQLYALEGAMLRRLRSVLAQDHTRPQAFFELIRQAPSERYAEFLDKADENHRSVTQARSFRPSVRNPDGLVARLLRLVLKSPLEGLPGVGSKIAKAVGCVDSLSSGPGPFIVGLLFRSPAAADRGPCASLGHYLLLAIYSAYQLTTAAKHADQYPKYPVATLRGLSADILRQLGELEAHM